MSRQKHFANVNWRFKGGDDNKATLSESQATLAVLMDIRDHMQATVDQLTKLNTLLHTPGLNNDMWGPSWLTAYIRAVKEATPALSVLDDRPKKCTHEPV